jgi:pimeloyl-ACP methyl ester carboxylesterase
MDELVVTDDGCRLWTTRTGTGDPLVLCHGGPGLWDTFGGRANDLRPRWAVDSLEQALPAARRVVLDGAGHLPWVEAPAGFRAAVAGFLTERFS